MSSQEYIALKPVITVAEAWRVAREHDVTKGELLEFLMECDLKDGTIKSKDLLEWLGY